MLVSVTTIIVMSPTVRLTSAGHGHGREALIDSECGILVDPCGIKVGVSKEYESMASSFS